ncbi:MAG: WecB/TagA/CpsF family glycosyltransferase, partial [Deltaproteobacteria bacterium]|nr:WecB/TagA/CpsF family glycosyltransferase [Deltaproteobacteria bacterium]
QRGWPVFWLGDTDEVGEEFQRIITARYPNLVFAGRHHGYFAKDGAESDAVARRINDSGAKILLVGMSMPIQEKWVWAHRDRLTTQVCLNVGGAARIVTGHIRRGPSWMTQNGLEWLYRLAMQPRYTWRRYLIGNPLFLIRLLSWRFFGLSPKPLRETPQKT